MRCNILMLSFVKKTLKKAHSTLVARLVEKAHLIEAQAQNDSMSILDARRDSTLPGCGTGLRPGYQSGSYSDTSSLRSSRLSQSPHVSHQLSTPLVSPSYQNPDPAYHDARYNVLIYHRRVTPQTFRFSPSYRMPWNFLLRFRHTSQSYKTQHPQCITNYRHASLISMTELENRNVARFSGPSVTWLVVRVAHPTVKPL